MGCVTDDSVLADPQGSGAFLVVTGRVFTLEGSHAATIVITDSDGTTPGHSAGVSVTVQRTVNVSPALLAAQGINISTTAEVPFIGQVASFSQNQESGTMTGSAADFTAQIAWGDGQTSTGTVTVDAATPGKFDVAGSHTYAHEGVLPVAVTILRTRDAASVTTASTATINDAPLTLQAVTVNATAGVPFRGIVGYFTDADPAGTIGDYSAKITWDDGSSSKGSVIIDPTNSLRFAVQGDHTFAQGGTFPVTVKVVDLAGQTMAGFVSRFGTSILPASRTLPNSPTPGAIMGASATTQDTAVVVAPALSGGDGSLAGSTSVPLVQQVVTPPSPTTGPPPPVTPADGPTLTSVVRFGFHASPTTLVLHFDAPLDSARRRI